MSDEVKKFFSTYGDFVKKVTSEPSLDLDALKQSLEDVESKSPIESARLMTAALGLGSETGEFVEIVKKMFLQGKPPSEENIFHMKRELGDIMWYWTTACAALELDPHEVIAENPDQITNYKAAPADKQSKMLGFFVGQVMKKSRGKANPQAVNQILSAKLSG